MGKQRSQGEGLPINVEAERVVLGSILLTETLFIQASAKLGVEDFGLESHRRIFRRMSDLNNRQEHINRITLINELMRHGELDSVGGISGVNALDEGVPELSSIDSQLRVVKEVSSRRRLIFLAEKMKSQATLGEEGLDSIVSGARDEILSLGLIDEGAGPQTLEQYIQGLPGGLEEFLSPLKPGIPTGFIKYDEMTGGMRPGELIIIAARPSMGKSAWAINVALHAALKQRKVVDIFSLEMSKRAIFDRMRSSIARVDSQRMRQNYLSHEERQRLNQATQQIADSRLHVDDKNAATLPELHSKLRRHMAAEKVDLVVVDYLQLMKAGKDFENRNQEVSYISRGLKLMAGELEVPMVVLSQLSRAPEVRTKGKSRPQLSDLRESGSIEQDADVVGFIYREEVYDKTREDLRGLAELIIGKQREGPVGTVNLVFLHNTTTFANRAEDTGTEDPTLNF